MPKLLILASNPKRDLPSLYREVRDLSDAVEHLRDFEVTLEVEVRSQDLQKHIARSNPQYVHFCGHGDGERGLVFQDQNGQEQLISTEALAAIFKTFSDEISCVVLNACDSIYQAKAVVEHIDFAIGMRQPILDQAAYAFAVGFYEGLAAQETIERAYQMGCNAILIGSGSFSQAIPSRQYRKFELVGDVAQSAQPQLPEHLKPILLKRSERLNPQAGGSNAIQMPANMLALAEPPEGFEDRIKQAVQCKEYKDQARRAYDDFGQYSAQYALEDGVIFSPSEYGQRQILLDKVREFWIKGFLEPSLKNFSELRLDLKERNDVLANLTKGIEVLSLDLNASYARLKQTQIYEGMGNGRTLLILGDPGSGKTIALLQLAQRLIDRSQQNQSIPIPVVFNLSSWAREHKKIIDWLIDELREKYHVPREKSKNWITRQQIILLLDGLDEVDHTYRNDCVRALNEFITLFPQTEVAICSRVKDYEALTVRLQISSALCLQPLSPEQIDRALEHVGGLLKGLQLLLQNDEELRRFAQAPLILNFMSVAYQGWTVERLVTELLPRSNSDRQKHLFDTYIDRRLDRGVASEYSKDKVLRWLSWLASQMVREKRTIFLIETMQPSWLKNRSEERVYRIRNFLITSLVGGMIGLTIGLLCGLLLVINGQKNGLLLGLNSGRGIGLAVGLISGLLVWWPRYISPLEQINWSWQRAKSRLAHDLFMGNILGLMGGIIYGFIGKFTSNWIVWLSYGLIYMLLGGLILGFSSGLGSSKIERRTVPNQGIQSSLRNSLRVGLGLGLTVWLTIGVLVGSIYVIKGPEIDKSILKIIFGIYFELISRQGFDLQGGLFCGLIVAPDIGLDFALLSGLKFGGAACIQHFTLRQMLYKRGRIPWNYAKFLDFASERLLMKKVGGGYVFFHRMLLEHFAQMNALIPQPLLPNSEEGELETNQSHSPRIGRGI